jgi:hypothetical protein
MAGVAFRQDLNAGTAIRQDPVAYETGGKRLDGYRFRIEAAAKSREITLERRNDDSDSPAPRGGIRTCKTRQQIRDMSRSVGAGSRCMERDPYEIGCSLADRVDCVPI